MKAQVKVEKVGRVCVRGGCFQRSVEQSDQSVQKSGKRFMLIVEIDNMGYMTDFINTRHQVIKVGTSGTTAKFFTSNEFMESEVERNKTSGYKINSSK